MTEQQEATLYLALRAAVIEAIDVIGIEAVREMSMFPSSKWTARNDNSSVQAHARAA